MDIAKSHLSIVLHKEMESERLYFVRHRKVTCSESIVFNLKPICAYMFLCVCVCMYCYVCVCI